MRVICREKERVRQKGIEVKMREKERGDPAYINTPFVFADWVKQTAEILSYISWFALRTKLVGFYKQKT